MISNKKSSYGSKNMLGVRFAWIIVLLILILPFALATDISDCGSTYTISSPGTYDVTQDLSTSITCIDVQSDDVVIDCHGYQLSASDPIIGINVAGYSNILVKNCRFTGFSGAIWASNALNLTVLDSSFISNNYGIYADISDHITISNVDIDDAVYGILMYTGNNSLIENSRIHNTYYAIYNADDWSVPIYNAIIANNTITNFSNGIYVYYSSGARAYNTNISGNTIIGNGTGNGMQLNYLEDSLIDGNVISNATYGAYFPIDGYNISITNINITDSTYGLVGYFGHYFNIDDAHLTNSIGGGANGNIGEAGIEFWWGDNVTIRNVYAEGFANQYASAGIHLLPDGDSYNVLVENYTATNNSMGINIGSTQYNTAILSANLINNVEDGINMAGGGDGLYVNNSFIMGSSDGIDISYMNFSVYNTTFSNNNYHYWLSNGAYSAYDLFNHNNFLNRTSWAVQDGNPITINVDKSFEFGSGIIHLSYGLVINTNAIVLDCNGMEIYGDGTTGNGIYIDGNSDVDIKNCNIHDYYQGIFADSSSNNLEVLDSNISNNFGDGIFIQYSNNINISNNFFADNQNDNYPSIVMMYVDGANIYNNTVLRDAGGAAYIYDSDNILFDSMSLYSNPAGISFYAGGENLTVMNSIISNTGGFGAYFDDSNIRDMKNINILDNNFTNTQSAVYRQYYSYLIDGMEISRNNIKNSTSQCVVLNYANNTQFNNNILDVCGDVGLDITNMFNLSIENLSITGTTYMAIYSSEINNSRFENLNLTDNLEEGMQLNCNNCYLNNILVDDHGTATSFELLDLAQSMNTTINNSVIRTTKPAIHDDVGFNNIPPQCSLTIENLVGKSGKQVRMLIGENDVQDENLSQLILCNASNSVVSNVTSASRVYVFHSINVTLSDVVSQGAGYGFYAAFTYNSTFNNLSSMLSKQHGFYLQGDDNTIANSTIKYANPNYFGLWIDGNNNMIYNNFFNNYQNFYSSEYTNYLNGSNQAGINILGGNILGGNAWLNTTDNGYSITCTDADVDGICDDAYDVMGDASNMDYYPLKYTLTPAPGNNCSYCGDCMNKIWSASPGDTIYLTEDIYDYAGSCIDYDGQSNVNFDCQGHLIDGIGSNYAVYVPFGTNVNISNCRLNGFNYGLGLEGSANVVVDGVNITSMATSGANIIYGQTENITIKNSNIQDSVSYGVYIDDWGNTDEIRSINIINNTLTNNPFGIYRALDTFAAYDINITGNTIKGSSSYCIYAYSAHGIIIDDNLLADCGTATLLIDSNDGIIKNTLIQNTTSYGIRIYSSSGPAYNHSIFNVTLLDIGTRGVGVDSDLLTIDSIIVNNSGNDGIGIWSGSNISVSNARIIDAGREGLEVNTGSDSFNITLINVTTLGGDQSSTGIYLSRAQDIIVLNANVTGRLRGINLRSSTSNIVLADSEFSNNTYGIYGNDFSNLVAYNNLLKNNTYAIYDDSETNTYDAAIFNDNTYLGNGYIFYDPLFALIYVNNPTTLPQGRYYLSDDAWNGVFVILDDDISFDCAGSLLEGNAQMGDAITDQGNGYSGIKIRNCNITNFDQPIKIQNANDSEIINITISNSYWGIRINSDSENALIADSSFYNIASYFIDARNGIYENFTIRNIYAQNCPGGLQLEYHHNSLVDNLTYDGGSTSFYYGNAQNSTIRNVLIKNIADDGLQTWGGDMNDVDFINITILNTTNNGFRGSELYNSYVENLLVNGTQNIGLSCDPCVNTTFSNVIIENNPAGDIYWSFPNGPDDCNVSVTNTTLSSGRLFGFFNTNVTLSNIDYGYLSFCNADNSSINNLSAASGTLNIHYTDNSAFSTLNFSGRPANSDGFKISYSSNNTFTNLIANNNQESGLRLFYSSNNSIISSVFDSNANAGLYLYYSDNNNIISSYFRSNVNYGISIDESGANQPNMIHDNFFNQTNNVNFYQNYRQNWNLSYEPGTNIVGGSNLGGNYWAKPDGKGVSQVCGDLDSDGICDQNYRLNWLNRDYFPLTGNLGLDLDTNITSCRAIEIPGTYFMDQDIIDATTSNCIDIKINDVALDCQGHTIDGDAIASNGIYVYRDALETTNITIRNCIVSDWANSDIFFHLADGNALDNINATGSASTGVYIGDSSNTRLSNITSQNNFHGVYILYSQNITMEIMTAENNSHTGIYLSNSAYNILSNITSAGNLFSGVFLESSSNNSLLSMNASQNAAGIYVTFGSDNSFHNITAGLNAGYGIYLDSSNRNIFFGASSNNNNYGVFISSSSSNNFSNLVADANSQNGIYIHASSDHFLSNISANDNSQSGLILSSSLNNMLSDIDASGNVMEGISISSSDNNILLNISAYSNSRSGVYLQSSSNNSLSDIVANDNYFEGIYLYSSSNNNILSNITANNNSEHGVVIHTSSNYNILSDIAVRDNSQRGVLLATALYCNISHINATNNLVGIDIAGLSNNNLFSDINTNNNTQYGIYLESSEGNMITDSVIAENAAAGIYVNPAGGGNSAPNKIYNNFFNNTNNSVFPGPAYTNNWNTSTSLSDNIIGGPYLGGNFWTNSTGDGYSDTCTDENGDGFCDAALTLESGNIDYLPLSEFTVLTGDNTTDTRDWVIDNNASILIIATAMIGSVNTTHACAYRAGTTPCTSFTSIQANETIVNLTCEPNSACQWIVRHYAMDMVPKKSPTIESHPTYIVYGSLVNDTSAVNADISDNSTITGSDLFNSNISSSTITNSRLNNSIITDSIITDSQLCGSGNNLIVEGSVLLSGVLHSGLSTYFSPFNTSKICGGTTPSIGVLSANDTIVKNGSSIRFSYSGKEGATISLDVGGLDVNAGSIAMADLDNDGVYTADFTISLNSSIENVWTNMNPSSPPVARYGHAMAYDSDSKVIVMYGGYAGFSQYKSDTWIYNLSANTWTNMDPVSPPVARSGSVIAYDSYNKIMVLYGGINDGNFMNDTWIYNLSANTWTNMDPVSPPVARYGSVMAYDSDGKVVVMYGGNTGSSNAETWAYNFSTNTWTNKNPASPPPARYDHMMAYDSDNDGIVMYGGYSAYEDTWVYRLSSNNWTNKNPASPPTARYAHAMAYDSYNKMIFTYGGRDAGLIDQTWAYTLKKPAGYPQAIAIINDNLGNTLHAYLDMTIDKTAPSGSISINGGEINAESRNVILDLNYSDENGISQCRYGNESTIASQWESCVPTKAWQLTQGYGAKTIFFEVEDSAGNKNIFNDTIEYIPAIIDRTAPAIDFVNDGLESQDKDYINSNTTLSARWMATDYESHTILYEYRILADGSNITGFIDAGTSTRAIVSMNLSEGTIYSFEIIASNPYGVSSNMTSDGAMIDLTQPDITSIRSATHPNENISYPNTTAIFNWSATDDSLLKGYSYVFDSNPNTEPDGIIEADSGAIVSASENGLEGLWHLDNKFIDSSSGDYDGAQSGDVAFTEGILSRAASFDGVDDFVQISSTPTLSTNAFAFQFWMRSEYASGFYGLVAGETDFTFLFALVDGKLQLYTNGAWGGSQSAKNIADGNWHHIAITGDGSNVQAYIDSVLQLTQAQGDIGPTDWLFGRHTSGETPYAYLPGELDEIVYYNRNLSAAQIASSYASVYRNMNYSNLASGTYYFHLKAIDDAGNYAVIHKKIIVQDEGYSISLKELPLNLTVPCRMINVTVSHPSDVFVYNNGALIDDMTFNGTSDDFFNACFTEGLNVIVANATINGRVITSNTVQTIKYTPQLANLSFTLSFSNTGTTMSKIAYYDTGDYLFGLASDSGIATPSASPISVSTNESASAYLFMAKGGTKLEPKNDLLEDAEFLDETSPSFGIVNSKYIVGTYLNYDKMIFIGNISFETGRYYISIQNKGLNADKKRVFLVKKA